jgi:cytochrome c-type biogenesis protein CcmE
MKNKGAIIGLVIILAALGFGATTFKNSLVTYLPFPDAMQATDSTVQIMGVPQAATVVPDGADLRFTMTDGQGHAMPVLLTGTKPEDFDSAAARGYKIAAVGTYDPSKRLFVADSLLVKCPSKYQGAKTASAAGQQ